jgi:hypothetical protein
LVLESTGAAFVGGTVVVGVDALPSFGAATATVGDAVGGGVSRWAHPISPTAHKQK